MNAEQLLSEFSQERVITTAYHSLLMRVQELARKNGVHHVPVMKGESLVGVVCTCDMMLAPPDTQVAAVMKKPVTIEHHRTVAEAASLMKERSVGSVVLMRGTTPCGILTRGDVFSEAPDVADAVELPRCSCCGVARHLRRTRRGATLCIFCVGSIDS